MSDEVSTPENTEPVEGAPEADAPEAPKVEPYEKTGDAVTDDMLEFMSKVEAGQDPDSIEADEKAEKAAPDEEPSEDEVEAKSDDEPGKPKNSWQRREAKHKEALAAKDKEIEKVQSKVAAVEKTAAEHEEKYHKAAKVARDFYEDIQLLEQEIDTLRGQVHQYGGQQNPYELENARLRAELAAQQRNHEYDLQRQQNAARVRQQQEAARLADEITNAAKQTGLQPRDVFAVMKAMHDTGDKISAAEAAQKALWMRDPQRAWSQSQANQAEKLQIEARNKAPNTLTPGATPASKFSSDTQGMLASLEAEGIEW